ncbi:MAG TPA: radical SAM protein [bacterium]|nr:radical SAM protein [bacterium]
MYKPLEGHPDWDSVATHADRLVREALEIIDPAPSSPRELLSEAARVADSIGVTAKSMFTNYNRFRKGDHTLLPPYYIWTMHNKCNFRCAYCDNHQSKKYFDLPDEGMLDTEQGKRLLEIAGKNVRGIYFCGGEPTLRKDLPELTAYAHSLNYFPLMINTNGSRIHRMIVDPRYRSWLRQMDIIIISLDALNIKKLSEVWGVRTELCEQVITNIVALRKLQSEVKFKLIVNTVITPETIGEADSILDWANDLGIWYSPVPMNCGPVASSGLISNQEYKKLAAKIVDRKKKGYKILGSVRLVESLLKSKPIRCYPTLKPHVDIDGGLYWPCKTKSSVEQIKINMLEHDSLDEAYRHAASIVSVDNIHGYGPGQCGADCNWMQNYVTDAIARGLRNPVSGGMIREIAEFVGVV